MAESRVELCWACSGQQKVAVYVLPGGRQVRAKHACQVCGQGEQDSFEDLTGRLREATTSG